MRPSLRIVAACALVGALSACPQPPVPPSLTLSASSATPYFDAPVTLRVAATAEEGAAGQGTVQLSATGGTLADSALTLDDTGRAGTTLSCSASSPGCAGSITVVATWNGLEARKSLRFGERPDGGTPGGSDGGSTDGGGTSDGGGTASPYAMDPSKVYAFGSASTTQCQTTMMRLDQPTSVVAGMPCPLESKAIHARRLLYVSQGSAWAFVADDATTEYPADPMANDLPYPTPCGDGGVGKLFSSSDDVLGVTCLASGRSFVGSTLLPAGEELFALASGNRRVVVLPGGPELVTPSGRFPLSYQPALFASGGVREIAGALNLVGQMQDGGCSLFELADDGTLTEKGAYSPMPSSVEEQCVQTSLALDPAGALYVASTRNGTPVVVKRPLAPGTSMTVFTDLQRDTDFDGGRLQVNAVGGSFSVMSGR